MSSTRTLLEEEQESDLAEDDESEADEIDKETSWEWPIETAEDLRSVIASTKSYVGPAALTFLLYNAFWLPGLMINIMYYREAKRMEELAKDSLPGVGCLKLQLYLSVLWLLVLALVGCWLLDVLRRLLQLI